MSTDANLSVLILGAASDIARAIAHSYGRQGRNLVLAARNSVRLQRDASDLKSRYGVAVEVREFDVLDTGSHRAFLDGLPALPETAVCAVGLLAEEERCAQDFPLAELVMRTNYTGPVSILGELANRMQARGHGVIIGISSVAGDRGRATNYTYGSAKAALTAFLSGLRNRLHGSGVRVITVKPGFVATRMTQDMTLPRLLTARPEEVGRAVVAADRKQRDIVYVRPIWRLIMLIIVHLPERIFKRLRL